MFKLLKISDRRIIFILIALFSLVLFTSFNGSNKQEPRNQIVEITDWELHYYSQLLKHCQTTVDRRLVAFIMDDLMGYIEDRKINYSEYITVLHKIDEHLKLNINKLRDFDKSKVAAYVKIVKESDVIFNFIPHQ